MTLFFFVFVLFGAVLIMNTLIGVLCEVVCAVGVVEREEMLIAYVRSRLSQVMTIIDEDCGGTISKDEFKHILTYDEAVDALIDIGVDVVGLCDFTDFIFGGAEVQIQEASAEGDEYDV